MTSEEFLLDSYNKLYDYYKTYMKQRTDSFNFFIIIEALLGNVVAGLFSLNSPESNLYMLLVLGAFFILPLLFLGLDKRTLVFIKQAKSEMKKIESKLKKTYQIDTDLLFGVDDKARELFKEKGKNDKNKRGKNEKRFIISMTLVFKVTYITFILIGLITFGFVIFENWL